MKNKITIFLSIIFFSGIFSCNQNNSTNEENGPALYPQPKSYPLNLKEGYKINAVTGDSIKPLVNSLGDTVKTGVRIPAIGKLIHPNSIEVPKTFKAGEGTQKIAHPNVTSVPKELTIIAVDQSKLKMVFNQWKGDLEQVDDVCIIGIRI